MNSIKTIKTLKANKQKKKRNKQLSIDFVVANPCTCFLINDYCDCSGHLKPKEV